MLHKVFVYGTLKKGFGNHRLLDHGKAQFISEGTTNDKYTMLYYVFPFVSRTMTPKTTIEGEVYEVDDKTFTRLDRLEGYPDFYDREQVLVDTPNGKVKVWMYFCDKPYQQYLEISKTGKFEGNEYNHYLSV